MRIIAESALRQFSATQAEAAPGLEVWRQVMRREKFRHFADLRSRFRSADQVRVASDKSVVVFNIHGNDYHLICAIFDLDEVRAWLKERYGQRRLGPGNREESST